MCKARIRSNKGTLSWSLHQIVFPFLTALRIHVSPDTSAVLQQFGTFDLELRGAVEMKVNSKGFISNINTTRWHGNVIHF